ncbi:probable cytochrome c oxidase-assembly factor cox-16, mitochondrial precursor [Cephalotrichum gorgonifer]|uniref:Cytochrome c oxidase assembly protein COX16, mitochondrial n=1 Tax=Cephalotrichum gorgonifer TaxID=2041049 RepID=A0AAE8MVU8_9PEZI|nr:probable cytochrome c oxidase-assembly factor cox-16, mitochondrial precursor [Cephalotrichum gorgonifer]
MAVFPSKKFQSTADLNSAGARYRSAIARRPFLFFGLPFLATIVAGSFVLTPATAIRYEKHDRKVKQLSKEQELDVRKNPRKVDWREEYQRLRADKDLDDWQQKRVERLPGEPDGKM